MKKKKIIIFIIAFILISGFISVYFSYLHRYHGESIDNPWSEEDNFDVSSIVSLEKKEGEDFKILNLADIQMADIGDFFHRSKIKKEIDYLIKETNPDLITLTGDQTWSNENLMSLKALISWLDSYGIPYAPVFGNHDYGNDYNSAVADLNYCCDLYEKGKYSLFKRGPSNLGCLGNYIINIYESGKIYKTIYMLDAGYYSTISTEQVSWVKWNSEHLKELNDGIYPETMMFMHKPISQFSLAYYYGEALNGVYVHDSFGGTDDNGLFELAKTINVTDITCGHQHANNFTNLYEGIRFTFALKTGELAYYYDDGTVNLNGATLFTLNDTVSVKSVTVGSSQFHIPGSDNIFYD